MSDLKDYERREQTLVKHDILKKYLERFAHVVGHNWPSITYVDCFSGPWNTQSEKHEDASFAIAIAELRKAQETLKGLGKVLRLRCFFIESHRQAYDNLTRFTSGVKDVEIETRNRVFADAIPDILVFVKKDPNTFPFIFIDPTGWTGFGMKMIEPLLQLKPCEVLVNFMTGHIRRFIEIEETAESFEQLFGAPGVRDRIAGATQLDREDFLVNEYRASLRRTGAFRYTCSAIVLNPLSDRTHFNLIYATRHTKGIEVFKEAERRAMPEMEKARAEAQQRERQDKGGQGELFAAADMPPSQYYEDLLQRYRAQAKQAVHELLEQKRRLPYDEAWVVALEYPLVWEQDLKDWIREWRSAGCLSVVGLTDHQRVPQHGKNHSLVWNPA
ncbi:MAG: three-Cys-motif partner protein TcmP [Planctomycetota bacterium]